VIAAALLEPGSEWRVFRALQLANFTASVYLDDADSIREALRGVPGIDVDGIVARIDDEEIVAEYRRQRAEAQSAAGTPAEAQGKTATSDGAVRFTAPSVVFRAGERSGIAGGWQPLLSYDTLVANLDPALARLPAPGSPGELLDFFPDGLTTAEVALLLADGPDPVPNREEAEAALSELVAQRQATRTALGSDAVWARAS
jgi:hypothetical protein